MLAGISRTVADRIGRGRQPQSCRAALSSMLLGQFSAMALRLAAVTEHERGVTPYPAAPAPVQRKNSNAGGSSTVASGEKHSRRADRTPLLAACGSDTRKTK